MAGIVGYGAYIPIYRVKSADIARVWGEEPKRIEKGLGIIEKAVAGIDEDTCTISTMAALNALKMAGTDPQRIGALYVGSESHPYVVKPTSTIVAEAIGATPNLTAADLEFACKAGTAGLQMVLAMVDSKMIDYGMAIGADTAQGRPGDALEYSAASGGAAFITGPDKESIAVVKGTFSFSTDTPDFWRRQDADYPSHGGRFTGEPAYFKHVLGATNGILEKTGMKVDEFDYVVFHQPNSKFPLQAAKKLGIPAEKLKQGLLVPYLGNTYSGATPLGLSSVLDVAKPGEMILATSFGSGAGSDSFVIEVTKKIENRDVPTVKEYLENKKYIEYATYLKYRRKLKV